MNKNKFIYILIMVIALFGFKSNVYADLRTEAKTKTCEQLIKDDILIPTEENILFDPGDREVNCAYSYSVSKKKHSFSVLGYEVGFGEKIEGCIIFQIAYNKDGSDIMLDAITRSDTFEIYAEEKISDKSKSNPVDADFLKQYEGGCPINVKYHDNSDTIGDTPDGQPYDVFRIGLEKNMNRIHRTDIQVEIPSLITDPDEPYKVSSCQEILGSTGVSFFKTIKNLIMIAVPIILIALGSLDFAMAVFSSDENAMKKSQTKFIKRIIIAVIIFLIPGVLGFILDLAHEIWPVIDSSLCGIYD